MCEEWYAVWVLPLKENVWLFRVRVNKTEIYQQVRKSRCREEQRSRVSLRAVLYWCTDSCHYCDSTLMDWAAWAECYELVWESKEYILLFLRLLDTHYCGTHCDQRLASIADVSLKGACSLITEEQHALIRSTLPAVSVRCMLIWAQLSNACFVSSGYTLIILTCYAV